MADFADVAGAQSPRLASDHGGLISNGELQVRLRDFDDDVSIVFEQSHKPGILAAWPSNRFELDVNFEIGTVLTDKCSSQPCGQPAFGPETLRRSNRIIPGLMVSIFCRVWFTQAMWSCIVCS